MLAWTSEGVGMLFGHQNDTTTHMPDPAIAQPSDTGQTLDDTHAAVSQDTQAPEHSTPHIPPAPSTIPSDPLPDDMSQTPPEQSTSPADSSITTSAAPEATGAADDLLNLKQQAVGQLTPLMGQLDQTPEEKFRTTMMMIQNTDNHLLLKDAFSAAQAITDDKARAQALLDVINEINYFTQPKN